MRKVGILWPSSANDKATQEADAAFRQDLRARGWAEGHNLRFIALYAQGNAARFASLATEMVKSAPHMIFCGSPGVTAALRKQTRSIPIVFTGIGDPVAAGIVASLARPGGNITGFTLGTSYDAGKVLQLLREIAPHLRHVAVIYNPGNNPRILRSNEIVTVTSAGLTAIPLSLQTVDDFKRFAALPPDTGVIFPGDPFTVAHTAETVGVAMRYHLPAIYIYAHFVESGGLISYGVNRTEQARQAAGYVDRILRGAKPGDLAVQNPIKYELTINLKTAKALGLTVSPSLLFQADKLIK